MKLSRIAAGLFAAGLAATASAEMLNIEVSGVGKSQIPVAICAFKNDSVLTGSTNVIRADLARTGLFRLSGYDCTMGAEEAVDLSRWRADGARALVSGDIVPDGSKKEIKYRLFDVPKNQPVVIQGFKAENAGMRLAAHRVADDIYQRLTGRKGIFSTRIAYVVKAGRSWRVEIADADGMNRQVALSSTEPIISPAWSPDGTKLAYVSFEKKKPVVYVQNLLTGQRTLVANFKGNNSAPSFSPDGRTLALALSKDGSTHIYTVPATGGTPKQLTSGTSINTEPRFSADGRQIYFTSDRGGGPQIYRMSAGGGAAKRVTFKGNYNISPRLSPDGKTLAYISRRQGYQLYAMDLRTGAETRLTETSRDESPSFSPNGEFILYAVGGRGELSVVSVDARVRQRLTMKSGDVREPTWGPYYK